MTSRTHAECSRARSVASYIMVRPVMAAVMPPVEAPVSTSTTKRPSKAPPASASRDALSVSSAYHSSVSTPAS